jgi:prevent-host-death family protein
MHKVNMHQAKTNLSKLANMVQSGEKVIIAKSGRPYVELIPYSKPKKQRTFGLLKDKIKLPDDFGELDDEISELFNAL